MYKYFWRLSKCKVDEIVTRKKTATNSRPWPVCCSLQIPFRSSASNTNINYMLILRAVSKAMCSL